MFCDQLARVLHDNFSDTVDKCVVVDCRYPYEYDGGHIQVKKIIVAYFSMWKTNILM